MKFLILTNHSYMLWQFRRELIEALLMQGGVVISTPFVGHEKDFAAMGCRCIETEVDRRGINPTKDLKLYHRYRDIIRQENPDMVITYSIKPNIYGGYACKKLHVPYCVNVQGLGTAFQKEPIASVVTIMYRMDLKRAKTVFFENQANADVFVHRRILKETSVTVLNGAGVNLNRFVYTEYPAADKTVRFLFLGRIMKEKGVDELFEAAERLKQEYGDQVQLDLVGFFEDSYKARVEQLEQEGVVVFHGFQSDPIPFYQETNCVVLPSYHEGMSNVLLEAAAIGRPLVTSDIPGCREAVVDGVSGYLCPKQSTEGLYQCMKRFMQLGHDQRKQMGMEGRRHVEEVFDKKKVVAATLACVEP